MNCRGCLRTRGPLAVGAEINESIFTPRFRRRSGAKRWVSASKEAAGPLGGLKLRRLLLLIRHSRG